MSRGWARWMWATCSVALVSASCGHTTSDPSSPPAASAGESSPSPPAVAGAGGGRAGAFGGASSTTAGSGAVVVDPPPSAGAPAEPMPHPAEPCEEPQASPYGGGFEHCADGSFRRSEPAACSSALPRSAPAKDRLLDECEYDVDCTEKENGYCELGECRYGCTVDSECEAFEFCFCRELIGQCRQAQCKSDADCPPDYPCTGNAYGFSLHFEVQCQTPLDECQSDNDCGNLLDLHWHCVSVDGARRCERRYVG